MGNVCILGNLTPVILTYNEERNIERTLSRLTWAKDIVIVDSESTDQTVAIASRNPRVRTFSRPFDVLARQWQFAIDETEIATEWVLALDADYVLSGELVEELGRLNPDEKTVGYTANFIYCVQGHPLRGSLYPPVTVLYRRREANYEQDGHAQRVRLQGTIMSLTGRIYHDDRKSLSRWLVSQDRYMSLEVDKLAKAAWRDLGWTDRIRKTRFLAPFAAGLWCLVGKGLILDGRAGLHYTLQRVVAESILALRLLERDLGVPGDDPS